MYEAMVLGRLYIVHVHSKVLTESLGRIPDQKFINQVGELAVALAASVEGGNAPLLLIVAEDWVLAEREIL